MHLRNNRKILSLIFISIIPLFSIFSESKIVKYERLMKEGSAKEISHAFMSDSSMAKMKLGPDKDTLIMTALKYDRDETIINLLLKAGCPVKGTNKNKQNSLMYACRYSSKRPVISTILNKATNSKNAKKDLSLTDANGKSAWDYSKENSNKTAYAMIAKYFSDKAEKQENAVIVIENEKEEEAESETTEDLNNPENEKKETESENTEVSQTEPDNPEENQTESSVQNESEQTSETEEKETTSQEISTVEVQTEPENLPEQEEVAEKPEITDSTVLPASNPVDTKKYDKVYLYDFVPLETEIEPEEEAESQELAIIEDPDKQDKNGRTALMYAAKNGNDWEIRSLLKSNAKINLTDKDGWTALMYAVRYQNNLELVNSLLAAGADPEIKNKYGTSALQLAAGYSGNPEILKKLISVSKANADDTFKAFIMAITSNTESAFTQVSKLKVFILQGLPINRFYEGRTPLMYAAEYSSSTEVIKLLLENGAQKNLRSQDGRSVINFAESNKLLNHDEIYWSLNQ